MLYVLASLELYFLRVDIDSGRGKGGIYCESISILDPDGNWPLLKLLVLLLWGDSGGCCDRRAFKSPEAENSLHLVCRKVCEICVMKSTRPVRPVLDPVPVGACMLHQQGATELYSTGCRDCSTEASMERSDVQYG